MLAAPVALATVWHHGTDTLVAAWVEARWGGAQSGGAHAEPAAVQVGRACVGACARACHRAGQNGSGGG